MKIRQICLPVIISSIAMSISAKEKRPNVLFILVDDLGYADLGFTGSSFYETPNIDKLAQESAICNEAYAACPVSSPSRAAIMTGKYPARINLTDYIPGNRAYGPHKDQKLSSLEFNLHLNKEEISIADAFRNNGYSTFFCGKWHLGEEASYFPDQFGFDINIGGNGTGHPAGGYFSPYHNPQLKDREEGEYLTDRLTDETINYINNIKDKPFFAFLSFYTVHLPLEAKAEKIEKYENKLKTLVPDNCSDYIKEGKTYFKQKQDIAKYAAMVESMDENVGRLLQTLQSLNLEENTIIVFTSDNGGMATSNSKENIPTSNLPLKAGKGYLYEGGIKVPTLIRWSGKIVPATINVPVIGTDFYPTLLDLCDVPLLPEQHVDGVSLKPILENRIEITRDAIYWHYPHYSGGLGGKPSAAIRSGDFKLIEFFEDNRMELYDVRNDKSESNDISKSNPEMANALQDKLHQWFREVNAIMPVANTYYIECENK